MNNPVQCKLLVLRQYFVFIVILFISACSSQLKGEFISYYEQETDKPYDDVLAELKVAIAEHNFRITAHSRIGKVIRDRGTLDFPEYDTIQFCNLTHAKTLLMMSPEAVKHMPCNIVTYQQHNTTIINTHLLPTDTDNPELNEFSEKMNAMLREIVDFAVEE